MISVSGPLGYASLKGWLLLLNTWNQGGLVYGTDFQIGGTYDDNGLTSATTFNWSFPKNAAAWSIIRAYPDIQFGDSPWGRGQADPSHVFPIQVEALKDLTANYDVKYGGDLGGYDVAFDIWLTGKPDGGVTSITNEVMVWLHKGNVTANGMQVGTYKDLSFSGSIYHSGTYTALIADSDQTIGQVDIGAILHKLEDLKIVSSTEYLTSIQFGAEVVEGTGSLTINRMNLNVLQTTASGTVPTQISPAGVTVGADHLVLHVSEDAYQGDAQFTVQVDGKAIGGMQTATASHALGASQAITLTGAFGTGSHNVTISFLNDAWGGSAGLDRNLYIDSIDYDGTANIGAHAVLQSNGPQILMVTSDISTAAAVNQTVLLNLSEDSYQGNAQFLVALDGKAINSATQVTALHGARASQAFSYSGQFGAGPHDLAISFLNDAWGGTASTDRNLYINSVDLNGRHYAADTAALMSAGTVHFQIGVPGQ